MITPTKSRPTYTLKFFWPLDFYNSRVPFKIYRFGAMEFGGSRWNRTMTFAIFGAAVARLERFEYDGESTFDADAKRYWLEWHKWETRAREAELRLAMAEVDVGTRQVIKDSLGIDTDNQN